jgi:hypothetical protein
VQSGHWRRDGLEYAGDHLARLPVVLAARVARTWSIYPFAPADKASFAAQNYGHLRRAEYGALLAYLVVLGLAAYGFPELRRRGAPPWLFLAPVALVTLISLGGFGDLRFRQAADVALAVLAGAGLWRMTTAAGRASAT